MLHRLAPIYQFELCLTPTSVRGKGGNLHCMTAIAEAFRNMNTLTSDFRPPPLLCSFEVISARKTIL